jgi:hypothetical protein
MPICIYGDPGAIASPITPVGILATFSWKIANILAATGRFLFSSFPVYRATNGSSQNDLVHGTSEQDS